jgi:hypothetical protein
VYKNLNIWCEDKKKSSYKIWDPVIAKQEPVSSDGNDHLMPRVDILLACIVWRLNIQNKFWLRRKSILAIDSTRWSKMTAFNIVFFYFGFSLICFIDLPQYRIKKLRCIDTIPTIYNIYVPIITIDISNQSFVGRMYRIISMKRLVKLFECNIIVHRINV